MTLRIVIFLICNFAALGLGGLFTAKGVSSEWYQSIQKAPWTPPGWVFGFAWTSIMICFSVYMAYLWPLTENKNLLIVLFVSQWILNVSWNPLFFHFHNTWVAFAVIVLLTLLTLFLLFFYMPQLKVWSIFILPYVLWLCIASSLNGYICLKNPG